MTGVARRSLVAIAAALLLGVASRPAAGATFSHAALDSVLDRVLRDGRVDYGALRRDHADLDRYLAAVAVAAPDGWPRDEQIAFWVNAYNARVLEGVIRRPGLKSVLDVRKVPGVPTLGFFRERRPTAGAPRSLDDIEHRILRARYAEPRVHFVLNCASVSCPVLPDRALAAATLEADLESATRRFLADSTRNRREAGGAMRVSMLFKWYAEDFAAEEGGVAGFIRRHWPLPEPPAAGPPSGHLEYDWSLNGDW